MYTSFLSFITISILLIFTNPLKQEAQPTTYYLTENGIEGIAGIHETSVQDLRKAFPGGKHFEPEDSNYFQFSEYHFKTMATFYIHHDTIESMMLQAPFKATILNNVILGSTTLPQFRALHPELVVNKKTNTLSQEFATCEFGNTTLTFVDMVTKQYNEKSMVFNLVQIGSMKKP